VLNRLLLEEQRFLRCQAKEEHLIFLQDKALSPNQCFLMSERFIFNNKTYPRRLQSPGKNLMDSTLLQVYIDEQKQIKCF